MNKALIQIRAAVCEFELTRFKEKENLKMAQELIYTETRSHWDNDLD